jgi:hypothetical protein
MYKVYDINTGNFIHDIITKYDNNDAVEFFEQIVDKNGENDFGRFLVCISDGTLYIYNASNGEIEYKYNEDTIDFYTILGIQIKNIKIDIMPLTENENFGKIIYASNNYITIIDTNNINEFNKSYKMEYFPDNNNLSLKNNYDVANRIIKNIKAISNKYIIVVYCNKKTIKDYESILAILDISTDKMWFEINEFKYNSNVRYIESLENDMFMIIRRKEIIIHKIINTNQHFKIKQIKNIKFNECINSAKYFNGYLIVNLQHISLNYTITQSFRIYN